MKWLVNVTFHGQLFSIVLHKVNDSSAEIYRDIQLVKYSVIADKLCLIDA